MCLSSVGKKTYSVSLYVPCVCFMLILCQRDTIKEKEARRNIDAGASGSVTRGRGEENLRV